MLNVRYKEVIQRICLGLLCFVGLGLTQPAWSAVLLIQCQLDGRIVLPDQELPMHSAWLIDLYGLQEQPMVLPLEALSLVNEDQLSESSESFLTRHALIVEQDASFPNLSVDLYRSEDKIRPAFNVSLPKLFKKNEIVASFKSKTKWTSSDGKQFAVFDLILSCSPTQRVKN